MLITITTMFDISDEDIDNIMTTALEGGINYWCRAVKVKGEYLGQYASEQISRGGSLILYDMESSDHWVLNPHKFERGLTRWLSDSRHLALVIDEFGCFDCGQIDAAAADEIIQLALFEEIMFG